MGYPIYFLSPSKSQHIHLQYHVYYPLSNLWITGPDTDCQIKRVAGEWKQTVQAPEVATVTCRSCKTPEKTCYFQQGKTCSRRFLVSFQSGFQGCRKEKKNLHIILLDCNYFNYTCEDTRLIVFSYGHGLCCILRLLIHAAYIRAGRVTLNPKSRNLIMLK